MKHKPPAPMNLTDAVALIAKSNGVTMKDEASADDSLSAIIEKTGYSAFFEGKTFADEKEKAMAVAEATGCAGLFSVITD